MASKVSGVIEKIDISGTSHAIASTAYGYCETAAGTQIKDVQMTGFVLQEGVTVHIKFQYANSASSPKLRINSNEANDAKPIVQYGTTAAGTTSETNGWYAGAVVSFTYDGTSWVRNQGFNTNTTYSYMRPYENTGKGSYSSQGLNPAKTATASWRYQLTAGKYFMYTHYYDNTAQSALTLNIGSTGAKPIYINGIASSSTNYTLPGGQYLVYYDGTNYHFRTDNKMPGNIAGDAATVNGLTVQTAVPVNAVFTDTKSFTITANATDGLWDLTGTNGTNAVTYALAPYSSKGTTATFYTAAKDPTLTTRLNYDGYLYATKLYSGGNEVLTSHRTYTAVSGKKPTDNQTPGFGSTFDIEQVGQDATGQVSVTERTVKIPDTAASTSTVGLVNTSTQSFAGIKTFYDHYTNGHIASTTTTAGQYAVIRCTNKGSWMTSFHVRMYTSYESYTLEISGYNYNTQNWYDPKAIMVASTSTSKVTVTFGYDNDATNNYKTLWVAIPIGNYPGIDVQSVVTGHTDTQPRFSVTIESSVPSTVQKTVDVYRPWYRNETVTNATTATTAGSVAWANTGHPDTFPPSSHTHGSITNDGKIGTTANRPIIASTGGSLAAASTMYMDNSNLGVNTTSITSPKLIYDLANTQSTLSTVFNVSGGSYFTNTAVFASNIRALEFRPGHTTYASYIYYGTSGNEALNFVNRNSVTSFIFWTGNSVNSANQWYLQEDGTTARADDPAIQIKQNSVYINKLLPSGTNASYKLYVNGTSYINGATTIATNLAGNSADLTISSSNALASGYQWGINHIVPNLGTGANTCFITGKSNSSKKQAVFGFHYDSGNNDDGSLSYVDIGMYSANGLVKVYGNGNVSIGGTSNSYKLHVNGISYLGGTTTVYGPLKIGAADAAANTGYASANVGSQNYIAFYGVNGDNPGSYNHTYIGESIYGPKDTTNEKSELLLFKGNDVNSTSGPDRIRLFANEVDIQVYTSTLSGTWDTIRATTGTQVANFKNGQVTITGNILPEANSTRTLGASGTAWDSLYINKVYGPSGAPKIRLCPQPVSTNTVKVGSTDKLTVNDSDEEWLKALLRELCIAYPNESGIFKGGLAPNSNGYYEVYIYNTSVVDTTTKLPQYSYGTFRKHFTAFYVFGTNSYSPYCYPIARGDAGTYNLKIHWDNVNSKPVTFSPSSHTHPATDITGTLGTDHGGTGYSKVSPHTVLIGQNTTGSTTSAPTWRIIDNADLPGSGKITIANKPVALGGSVTLADMGLSAPLRFVGTTTSTLSDNATTSPIVIGGNNYTQSQGDVVLTSNGEYLWNGSRWDLLGDASSFKKVQSQVNTSTASGNSATTFVSSVTQNTEGVITVNTSTLDTTGNWDGKAATADKLTSTAKTTEAACMPDASDRVQFFRTSSDSTGLTNDGHIIGLTWSVADKYGAQIFIDTDPTYKIALRQRDSGGTWKAWKNILTSYTTAAGTNNNAILDWNTPYTIAKIDGTDIKFTTMVKPSYAFTDLTAHPTTISGYGITNAVQYNGVDNDTGSSASASSVKTYWANNDKVPQNKIVFAYNSNGAEYTTLFSNRANSYGTVLKWGYTDTYIRILRRHPSAGTENDRWYSTDWEKISAGYADSAPLSGITEADDLKAIEALSGTSGFLKKTAANTWALDTNSYSTTSHDHNGTYVPMNTGVNDINTIYDTSIKNITSGSMTNGPVTYGYGQLLTMSYRKHTGNSTTDWASQIYAHLGSGTNSPGNVLYYRTSNASTWQTWQMVAHTDAGTAKGGAKKPIYIDAKGIITEGDALKNLAYKDSLAASDIPDISATYKTKQTAVSSATAETTTATTFVYSVTQDANGAITVKTRPLPTYNNYSLPTAKYDTLGGVKPWYSHTAASTGPTAGSNATAVAVNAIQTTAGRYYAIESDSNGRLFVNVPWTNVNSSYLTAHNNLVKQTVKSDNVEYQLLATASTTTGNAEAVFTTGITLNASTKAITASIYKVTSNATISYNSTNGCLEIVV